MTRKPVNKLRLGETRDAVWAEIRNRGESEFTSSDIVKSVFLEQDTVRDYITGLHRAGYLGCNSVRKVYFLIKDCGIEAPRVRKDGTAVTMGLGREQIWRALGILGQKGIRFNPATLVLHSSSLTLQPSQADVKHYLRYLVAAGYVVVVTRGKSGTPAEYRMLHSKWTGPKPPQIQRVHQLYDPNSKQVVWSEDGGSE